MYADVLTSGAQWAEDAPLHRCSMGARVVLVHVYGGGCPDLWRTLHPRRCPGEKKKRSGNVLVAPASVGRASLSGV